LTVFATLWTLAGYSAERDDDAEAKEYKDKKCFVEETCSLSVRERRGKYPESKSRVKAVAEKNHSDSLQGSLPTKKKLLAPKQTRESRLAALARRG
jgi:hypothetical protein